MNAVYKAKNRDKLLEIPVCVMPGGSWNATACDLNGRCENWAATNLLRGETVDKELIVMRDIIR